MHLQNLEKVCILFVGLRLIQARQLFVDIGRTEILEEGENVEEGTVSLA